MRLTRFLLLFSSTFAIILESGNITCYNCLVSIDLNTGKPFPGFGSLDCKNDTKRIETKNLPKFFDYELPDGSIVKAKTQCLTTNLKFNETITFANGTQYIQPVETFERAPFAVYNGSRLWNTKKAFVNDFMYSCGSNCSTCSSEFQDESQVKPNFTDHENPCTGYCYFNQVRFDDAEKLTTVTGGPDCKDAVDPKEGSCSTKTARIFFSQASDRSNLCQVGKMSLTADDGRTHPKPDQVSYYRFCLKMHEFPADGFLVTNIKSDRYELCDTDLCNSVKSD